VLVVKLAPIPSFSILLSSVLSKTEMPDRLVRTENHRHADLWRSVFVEKKHAWRWPRSVKQITGQQTARSPEGKYVFGHDWHEIEMASAREPGKYVIRITVDPLSLPDTCAVERYGADTGAPSPLPAPRSRTALSFLGSKNLLRGLLS
ncbi:hypothetical protein K0M31_016472, partial [Melipona bicolor]